MAEYEFSTPGRAFEQQLRRCLSILLVDQSERGVGVLQLSLQEAGEGSLDRAVSELVSRERRDRQFDEEELFPHGIVSTIQIWVGSMEGFAGANRLAVVRRLSKPSDPGSISSGRYVARVGADKYLLWLND